MKPQVSTRNITVFRTLLEKLVKREAEKRLKRVKKIKKSAKK